jgi:hypothetical protein
MANVFPQVLVSLYNTHMYHMHTMHVQVYYHACIYVCMYICTYLIHYTDQRTVPKRRCCHLVNLRLPAHVSRAHREPLSHPEAKHAESTACIQTHTVTHVRDNPASLSPVALELVPLPQRALELLLVLSCQHGAPLSVVARTRPLRFHVRVHFGNEIV